MAVFYKLQSHLLGTNVQSVKHKKVPIFFLTFFFFCLSFFFVPL